MPAVDPGNARDVDQSPDVLTALNALGGVARRGALVAACGRNAVDHAVRSQVIVPMARGTWASAAGADAALAASTALNGHLTRRTAALAWGWAVRTVPEYPEVVVDKSRRIRPERLRGVILHRADLGPDERDERRTSRERTLVDCLRSLPLAEALSIADSALRSGMPRARLLAVARDVTGPGSRRVRQIADLADGRSANPFESSLRAICLGVPGLSVEPQVPIHDPGFLGRPDLVDTVLRIVLEADSFEWHGERGALCRDARRYNALVAAGWLVLRFTWEDVMFHPVEVAATLRAVVERRTDQVCVACRAA